MTNYDNYAAISDDYVQTYEPVYISNPEKDPRFIAAQPKPYSAEVANNWALTVAAVMVGLVVSVGVIDFIDNSIMTNTSSIEQITR